MTPLGIGLIAAVFLIALILYLIRRRRISHLPMDDMDGREFEEYCASLLEKCGFLEPEITRASHDYGVDIITEKDGISYAIQCKRHTEPVGIKAIQEAYAGRDYYDCMVGVVMTSQYFTAPATELAKKLKILLWDRGYIEQMESE